MRTSKELIVLQPSNKRNQTRFPGNSVDPVTSSYVAQATLWPEMQADVCVVFLRIMCKSFSDDRCRLIASTCMGSIYIVDHHRKWSYCHRLVMEEVCMVWQPRDQGQISPMQMISCICLKKKCVVCWLLYPNGATRTPSPKQCWHIQDFAAFQEKLMLIRPIKNSSWKLALHLSS